MINIIDMHEQTHVHANAIVLSRARGGDVSTKILDKICKILKCQIYDIVDYIPKEDNVQENLR